MNAFGLDYYDERLLNEAKQRITVVYEYNYGKRKVRSRIETILKKIDELIEEERNGTE